MTTPAPRRDPVTDLPVELASRLRDVPPGWDLACAVPWVAVVVFWVAVAVVLAVYA